MGRERYVVDAVVLEGRSHRDAAKMAGISKAWVDKLVSRFKTGGYDALEPRSRRPKSCSHAVDEQMQAAILELRQQLERDGFDSGPHTIAHHLELRHPDIPSVATIWRILKRHGLITPQPQKRPRCSFVRFEAELPNEMWQADFTHWHLADGSDVEILNFLDDHSRLLTACDVYVTVKAADVVRTFYGATENYGLPASTLTDNGAVFTGKTRKGKVLFETELERLGITSKNSRPYHPQTCGKVERFHQTLKKYLDKQPPAISLAVLQLQLDTFRTYYNQRRPHRALGKRTPLKAFNDRLKAKPIPTIPMVHFRVRTDRVGSAGKVTIRHRSRLHHVGVGRAYAGQPVTLLVADAHVRILAQDGSLIRELVLDPSKDYQPLLARPKPTARIGHDVVRQVATMS